MQDALVGTCAYGRSGRNDLHGPVLRGSESVEASLPFTLLALPASRCDSAREKNVVPPPGLEPGTR